MPVDMLLKYSPLDSITSAADRASREQGQAAQLALATQEAAGRGDARDAALDLKRQALALQKARLEAQGGKTDDSSRRAWMQLAAKTSNDENIDVKRRVAESAAKVYKLLQSDPLIPGAAPNKAQQIAIGLIAVMAQDGDKRLSDADRQAVVEDWGILQNINGLFSRKAFSELNEDQVAAFNEALLRIGEVNDDQLQNSFDYMAMQMPNNQVGREEWTRVINSKFGKNSWFKDKAEEYGIPVMPKLAGKPIMMPELQGEGRGAAPSPSQAAPSDEEMEELLKQEGL
jgi:hypothetical protein